MLSGSIWGSTRLMVPNRILPCNVLLKSDFYSCEEIPATKQAHRTTAQIPSKVFPKFHILPWFVLISFYLANISSVLMPRLGPLWRLFTFTLTHAAHLALGRAPPGPGFRSNSPILHTRPAAYCSHTHRCRPGLCLLSFCLVQA